MFSKVVLIAILLIVGSQAQHLDSRVEAQFARLMEKFDNKPTAVKDVKGNVEAFVQGFVEGILAPQVFNEIKTCISEAIEVEQDVTKGMELINTKNPEKVKEGVQLIGKAVQIIPVAASECRAADADIQKLIKLVTSFTDPKSFIYYVAKSLIINRVEVMAEVNAAVEAYQNKDFHGVGYNVGKAMNAIFMGDKNVLRQEMVDFINSKNLGWKAEIPAQFKDQTLGDFTSRLIPISMLRKDAVKDMTVMNYEGLKNDIPAQFDSRQQWPGCVHAIRNQGHCGSCWAFAASESLSDRFCIASDKKINNVLAPQYLVSCDNVFDHGCNGGYPAVSWKFMEWKGMVTDDCLPYQSGTGTNPVKCKDFKKCADGSEPVNYFAKKGSSVTLPNPTSIQVDILKYGPVEGAFEVYEDFKAYKGGVYKHTTGSLLGGHAVKIVGWGQENGENYWIVANSWTENWGEKGFFRIAFGECGIDTQAMAGEADLERVNQSKAKFSF